MSDRPPDDELEQHAAADREAAAAQQQAAAEAAPPPAKMSEEELAARKAAATGAQVVLDPASDAALAAKGAMGRTMQDNVVVRDAALGDMGLDPAAPSAHQTDDRAPKPDDPKPAA